MSRLLGALLLALMLPACADIQAVGTAVGTLTAGTIQNVTPRQVYELEASYVIVRQGLRVYRKLPWCAAAIPAPCQTSAVAVQIKKADKLVIDDFASLDAFSKAHDTINIAAAYDAAQKAVDAAKALAAAYAPKGV